MRIVLLMIVVLPFNSREVYGCGGCGPGPSPPRRTGWSEWQPSNFEQASCQGGYKYMRRHCDGQCSGQSTMKQDCDECAVKNGGCGDHICKNVRGSYSCSCKTGYKKSGQKCEKLQCPTLRRPSNGKLESCHDRSYQGSCKVKCDPGYHLKGDRMRYCITSGNSVKWTGSTPTCHVKTCQRLPDLQNGQIRPEICKGAPKHGHRCTLSCNAGYTGSESTSYSITCEEGSWRRSSTGFYCSDRTPPRFKNNCPIFLNVSADSGKTSATVYWNKVSATDSGGRVTLSVEPKGASSPRTFPEGTNTITYLATDASNNRASCQMKVTVHVLRCPVLYAPPNGKLLDYSCGNVYGSVCRIECNTGFTLKGSNKRKCQKKNSNEMYWTGIPTRCEIVQCLFFPIPDNAIKSGYGCIGTGGFANYSTTCLTSCKTGFEGSIKRTCLETGQWSGSQLVCSAITCPSINTKSEGLVVKPDSCANGNLSYATECRFTCKEGYQLLGTGLKTCTQSARMLPAVNPSCKDVAPPKFLSCPENIFVTAAREETSSKVEWVIPDVIDNSGIPPNVTLHGENSGTIFNQGDHIIRYSATDKKGNLAECTFKVVVSVVRCIPKLAAPPGGKMECRKDNIYGSVCSFSCRHGYTLEGSVRRVCEMNGTTSLGVWTGINTRCALVRCPHLTLSANTLQSGCGGKKIQNVFGDKCLLYCQRGFYQVSGSTERICQANGTWSGQPLHCREVKCLPLRPPAQGYVKPDVCSSSPKFGVSCYFSCRKGFRLVGEPLTSCLSNGKWSANSTTICKDRESPSFGRTCPDGFRATADKGKNYTTVSWPPLVATDNSGTNPVVTSSGVTPKYFKGKHLVVYNATDQAGNFKICQFYISIDVTRCQRLLPPLNGFFVGNCGDTYGSRCAMGCNEGYYLDGSATTTCLVKPGHLMGYWDTQFPTCKIRTCSKLKAPPSGFVSPYICTISPVSGTYCDFECKYGYKMVGNIKKVHCGKDGKWDKDDKPTFKCKDVVPPLFLSCPLDIAVSLENSKAEANWTIPVASDNSNLAPVITVSPKGVHPPHSFSETTRVDYIAADSAGNIAKCSFKIEVEDNEGPEVVYCPPDMELIATRMTTIVIWKQPQFKDNSDEPLNIRCSHKSGSKFYWGTWNVQCLAYDNNQNNDPAVCKFTINVKPNDCPDKKPPKNGAMSCDDWALGRYCIPFCNDRWDFVQPLSIFAYWFCDAEGKWIPPVHWPDCSLPYQPSQVRRAGALHYYTGDCTTPGAQAQIKSQFIQMLKASAMKLICNDAVYRDKCKAENVKVTCGLVDNDVNRKKRETGGKYFTTRLRRAAPVAKITFEIVVELGDLVTDNNKQSKVKLGDLGVQITRNISKQIMRTVDEESIPLTLNGKKILPDKKSLNFSQPRKVCAKGQTFRDGFCLNCTAGTYLNRKLGTCEDCAIGFYQEQDAQVECTKCPAGTSTTEVRTDNSSSCLAICEAGAFSPTGLEPCIPCEKGHFQDRKGQTFCTKCKEGQTTSSEGSNSSADCGIACPMGSFSATGLQPCTLCDRRSFQPNTGRRDCLLCPGTTVTKAQGSKSRLDCLEINECDSSPCINNSTCKSLVADYLCSCPLGFVGKQCEININDCKDDPCLNNGTCQDLVNGFICTCVSGYEGINCENDVDECISSPCLNNASCSNAPGDFTCICEPGFTGDFCDVEIDECSSSPCLNGATCVDKINGYDCVCDRGYQGTNCDDKLEACASFPCQNGARCVDGTNSYQCICSVGYKGQQCETNIDDCASIPCLNNATCIDGINEVFCHCENGFTGKTCEIPIDECLLDVCQNNGTCINTDDDNYKCECMPGFDGLYCENNIDDCASNPCSNQAICQDEVNNFTCSCPPGYTGKDCNVDIDECETSPCFNNATCLDDLNSFTCQCVDGFEGALCETEIYECTSSPCGITGYCIDQVNGYRCECFYGFTGMNCEINIDDCDTNPCLNDGTCVDSLGDFKCACKTGYAGKDCSIDTNDCWSFPCYNNGTCVDKVNHYVCECPEGFLGSRCETNAIDCFENLCLNEGICRDGINSYTCDCASGFWGQHCEIEINECDSFPCLYGGSCHDQVNGFRCTCLTGFTGIQCEKNINDCELNPCANNGTCLDQVANYTCSCPEGFTGSRCESTINYCAGIKCEHGGKCINSPKGYKCECLNGYFGEMCQLEIDECSIQPCFNDATCIDGVNNFTCQCPEGFTGEFCEEDIDDCATKPCKNSVACVDYINGFSCICSEGYNGTLCENDIDECECSPCLNNGTCKNLTPGYKCDCLDIFEGQNCETEWDVCQSRPCRNGGNCSIDYSKGTFLCTCPPGFTGLQCENDIDDCLGVVSCFENSFCVDLVNGYKCECLPSYTGDQCEILLGSNFDLVFKGNSTDMVLLMDNDRVPSMHRFTIAMFVRADSKFKSGTLFGYSVEQNIGETILLYFSSLQIHLQIKDKTISADSIIADDQWHFVAGVWDGEEGVASLYFDGLQIGTKNNILKGSLMLGGGSISLGKRYLATEKKADASTFFSGTLHQVNVWSTAAQSDHMLLAAQNCTWPIPGSLKGWSDFLFGIKGKVERKFKSDCKALEMSAGNSFHFKKCGSRNANYFCICEPGFTGDHCKINIDECASNPCVHGKCVDGINQYDCVCRNGYWGKNCEKKMNVVGACPKLGTPFKGYKNCSKSAGRAVCTLKCHEGHSFDVDAETTFECGPDTRWRWNRQNKVKLPRCSSDVLSSEIKHKFALRFTDSLCQQNQILRRLPVLVQREVWTSLRSIPGCSFADECKTLVSKTSKCGSAIDAIEILFLVSIKSSHSTLKVTIDDTSEAVLFQLQYVVSTGKFTISLDGIYITAKRSSLKHLSTQFKCPPGSVLNIKRAGCVACPAGTFYDKKTLKCKACGPGSYQDREGQTSCLFYNGQGKRK